VEGLTEVVTAMRADVATIADGLDPTLAQHVAGPPRALRLRGRGCLQPRSARSRSRPGPCNQP
jgi:hypothetical protein